MIHYFAMLSSNMIFDFYFFFIYVYHMCTQVYMCVCVCAYAKVNNKNEKKFKNCMKSYMLLLTYSLNKRGIE